MEIIEKYNNKLKIRFRKINKIINNNLINSKTIIIENLISKENNIKNKMMI